jgi:hypothetical protein
MSLTRRRHVPTKPSFRYFDCKPRSGGQNA